MFMKILTNKDYSLTELANLAIKNRLYVAGWSLRSFERIQKDQDVTLEEMENTKTDFSYLPSDAVTFHAAHSLMDPKINHFHIPQIELCGATTMFTKDIWLSGMRFNPPGLNLRVSPGEDSDFNIRCALLVQSTIVFGAKLYYYRQNTGTTICEK
jgi:hypothetical protein